MKQRFIEMIFLCFFSLAVQAEGVKLPKMTMSIGGRAAMPMSFNRHGEFELAADIAPRFGIFLIDNLELATEFTTQFKYIFSAQERQVRTPVKWGLSSEVAYYFNTPSIITPYIGAGLGFRIMNWNLLSINLTWHVPIGMLIALEKNFAIELGLGIKGFMSFRSLAQKIEFSPGFIGFRYFF